MHARVAARGLPTARGRAAGARSIILCEELRVRDLRVCFSFALESACPQKNIGRAPLLAAWRSSSSHHLHSPLFCDVTIR